MVRVRLRNVKVFLGDWIYFITSIYCSNVLLAIATDIFMAYLCVFINPAKFHARKKSLLKQTPIWDVCMLPMYICGCTPDANVETFWLFFHWQKITVCRFCPPCNRSARIFCLYVIAVIIFLKTLSSLALQTLKWSRKLHIHLFMKNVFLSLCVCNKRNTYSALQMSSGVERKSRLPWCWWRQNFTIALCWI